ncbi:MAG: DUF6442 family protein [Endomicrobium sp.]|jgi:hypothetical protein|nr:DUF6442 family protein [Endomicrobium sp.]
MKDRILKESLGNQDEMEMYLYTRSWKRVFVVACIVMALFSAVRAIRGEQIFDMGAIATSGICVHNYFMFFNFDKEKKYLIPAVISNIVFVICTIAFVVK